jgi:STE24 endopeptidase
MVLALVAIAGLASSPVESAISRRIETRADVDALRATRDPAAFEVMQVRLAERSLADPTPPAWSQLWFGSHPTTLERLGVADRVGGDSRK